MYKKRPYWFGYAFAPLSVTIMYSVWAILFWTDPTPKQEFSGFDSYAISGWVISLITLTACSYLASAILGIPLITLLKRNNKLTFKWIVLSSISLGAITLAGILYVLLESGAEIRGSIIPVILQFLLIGSVVGAVIATTFCNLVGIPISFYRDVKPK